MTSITRTATSNVASPHGNRPRRPRTHRALISVGVVATLILAACSGDGTSSSETSTSVAATLPDDADDGELQDASSVRAERAVAGDTFEVGEVVTVGDVSVKINSVTVDGDDGGPWLAADTTVENRAARDTSVPNLSIYCAGNENGGGWQAFSTLGLGDVLPGRSVDNGVVNLLAPGDERFGDGRPFCDTPAVIRITEFGVNIAVPESVVDELNNTEPVAVRVTDPDEPTTALTPEPQATGDMAVDDDGGFFDLVERLNAGGVVCDTPMLLEPEQDETFGMVPPEIEFRCTSPDIGTVTFTRWSDAATLRGVARVFIELGGAFGFNLADASVLMLSEHAAVWADSMDLEPGDPAVTAWLQSAQDVLGGNITTFGRLVGN